jgi:hypothetical protein
VAVPVDDDVADAEGFQEGARMDGTGTTTGGTDRNWACIRTLTTSNGVISSEDSTEPTEAAIALACGDNLASSMPPNPAQSTQHSRNPPKDLQMYWLLEPELAVCLVPS